MAVRMRYGTTAETKKTTGTEPTETLLWILREQQLRLGCERRPV